MARRLRMRTASGEKKPGTTKKQTGTPTTTGKPTTPPKEPPKSN